MRENNLPTKNQLLNKRYWPFNYQMDPLKNRLLHKKGEIDPPSRVNRHHEAYMRGTWKIWKRNTVVQWKIVPSKIKSILQQANQPSKWQLNPLIQ